MYVLSEIAEDFTVYANLNTTKYQIFIEKST